MFSIVCYSKRFGPRGIGHCGAGGQSIGLTCDLNDEIERYNLSKSRKKHKKSQFHCMFSKTLPCHK